MSVFITKDAELLDISCVKERHIIFFVYFVTSCEALLKFLGSYVLDTILVPCGHIRGNILYIACLDPCTYIYAIFRYPLGLSAVLGR